MTIANSTNPIPRTQILTSLAQIKSFNPCASGWKDILTGQKKTQADDVESPLIDCLDSNSVADVFWLFQNLNKIEQKGIFVVAARGFADSVKKYNNRFAAAYASAAADAAAYASAADAAAYASAAAAYASAAAAYAASDAAYASAAYASASDASASDAAYAAAYAAASDAAYAAYQAARKEQQEKNKQILREAILAWEAGLIS